MSTSHSVLLSAFLAIFLALVVEPASAQPTGDQTRPRSLTNTTENPGPTTHQYTSARAAAEAKRLYKAGVEYGEAGLFSQAASLFEQALKLRPDYAEAYASLGHAYFDLKQWDKAITALEQALILKPNHKESRERLAAARAALAAEPKETGQRASSDEQQNNNRTPSITATKVAVNEASLTKIYRVGPGDVLDVRFGDAPSESDGFTVTSSGFLEHPALIQPLPVKGLTVEEIADRVNDMRKSTNTTRVSVSVRDYVSHRIIVSGLVKDPGMKILRREAIPLSVVIADAQRLPEAEIVKVVRNETNEVFNVELANDSELGLLIRPGDVITLETAPTRFFYVGGEVKSPGEKVFHRGLTLTQAILSAGGLAGKANEVRLGRDAGGGFVVMTRYKLKDIESGKHPDPLIQPGDRITVVK